MSAKFEEVTAPPRAYIFNHTEYVSGLAIWLAEVSEVKRYLGGATEGPWRTAKQGAYYWAKKYELVWSAKGYESNPRETSGFFKYYQDRVALSGEELTRMLATAKKDCLNYYYNSLAITASEIEFHAQKIVKLQGNISYARDQLKAVDRLELPELPELKEHIVSDG